MLSFIKTVYLVKIFEHLLPAGKIHQLSPERGSVWHVFHPFLHSVKLYQYMPVDHLQSEISAIQFQILFFTYMYMNLQSIYLSVLGLGLQDIDVVFKCMVPSERDNLHLYSFLLFNPFSGTQVTSEQHKLHLEKDCRCFQLHEQ